MFGCSVSDEVSGEASEEVSAFKGVDIEPETPPDMQSAVQACAGLYNRKQGGSVHTRIKVKDSQWLEDLHLEPNEITDTTRFLETCVTEFPTCVRYSYSAQQNLLPDILTVGAVLGAIISAGRHGGSPDERRATPMRHAWVPETAATLEKSSPNWHSAAMQRSLSRRKDPS
jgi:hypothetical protein